MTIFEILSVLGLILSRSLSFDFLLRPQQDHICERTERDVDCLYRFEPVCALIQGGECKSGMCYQNKLNPCLACSENSVFSYTAGPCKQVKENFCPHNNPKTTEECPETLTPICAFYTGGDCNSTICSRTILNACTACVNKNVLFYLNGECSDTVSVCQPEDRLEELNKEWLPVKKAVVAFYQGEDCDSTVCSRTEISGRDVCQDPNVLFYVPDPLEIGLSI